MFRTHSSPPATRYPVARCVCNPGYYGESCEHLMCLNNCSWPNGVCNATTGDCECAMVYNPYYNVREYYPWFGEDCSYLTVYSGGVRRGRGVRGVVAVWGVVVLVLAGA